MTKKKPETARKKKIWHRHIYDEKLVILFRKKLTDEEIGQILGFCGGTVENHRARLGLSRRTGEGKPKDRSWNYIRKPEPEPRPKHNTGWNPDSHVARAKTLLRQQGRLEERQGAIYIDGSLVKLYLQIVTEANRIRKRLGLDQEGPNEARV